MKKYILFFVSSLVGCITLDAQVTIGANATPQASAVLDLRSNGNKGLLLPRVTDTSAIVSPVAGMQVYATSNNKIYYYANRWLELASDSTGWLLNGNRANGVTKFLGYIDSADLVFKTNNIEQLRIKGNGKVGIGTSNPLEKLHVVGNQKISGKNALLFGDSAKANNLTIGMGSTNEFSYPDHQANLIINDSVSGNFKSLGIGYLGDIAIAKNITNTGTVTDIIGGYFGIDIESQISPLSTGPFSEVTSGYYAMANFGTGNIGNLTSSDFISFNLGNSTVENQIGINVITQILDPSFSDVSNNSSTNLFGIKVISFPDKRNAGGSATVLNSYGLDVQTGAHAENGGIATVTNNSSLHVRTPENTGAITNNYGLYMENQAFGTNNYAIYYAGVSPFVIKGDGNTGIGTNNPTAKLEVNGTIKATSINFTGLATYANDAAAGAGGLVAGDMYKTATGELRIKL